MVATARSRVAEPDRTAPTSTLPQRSVLPACGNVSSTGAPSVAARSVVGGGPGALPSLGTSPRRPSRSGWLDGGGMVDDGGAVLGGGVVTGGREPGVVGLPGVVPRLWSKRSTV